MSPRIRTVRKPPVKDMEPSGELTVSELVEQLGQTAYNARRLFDVADTWLSAVQSKSRIYFTLAGAMTPAGMRRVIAKAIENNFIDVIATTGANMVHDSLQGVYKAHIIGSPEADDTELFKEKLFRIYDVYLINEKWAEFGEWLDSTFFPSFVTEKRKETGEGSSPTSAGSSKRGSPYEEIKITPAHFLNRLGKELSEKDDNGILATAYKYKVPIYCPALMDSDFGIRLHCANLEVIQPKYNARILVDQVTEYDSLFEDMDKHENRGIMIVGGGTPKNFVLQASMALPTWEACGFRYAAQITTDAPQWGGLSGATLSEAMSWGKIKGEAKTAIVYCDATIALPLIVSYLMAKTKRK
nr:deoxyhypusine synthase family protein [Candidatus Njordarchaeum guaymaensis]